MGADHCLISDEGLFDLKDFYSKIEKYINRSSLYRDGILLVVLILSCKLRGEICQFYIQ